MMAASEGLCRYDDPVMVLEEEVHRRDEREDSTVVKMLERYSFYANTVCKLNDWRFLCKTDAAKLSLS